MGFIDQELNRRALIKVNNDISEAITILTGYNCFLDDNSSSGDISMSMFNSPNKKEQFESLMVSETCKEKET